VLIRTRHLFYPVPDECSLHHPLLFPFRSILILSSRLCPGLSNYLFNVAMLTRQFCIAPRVWKVVSATTLHNKLTYSFERPGRLWGPPDLQLVMRLFAGSKAAGSVKLAIHPYVLQRLGTLEAISQFFHVTSCCCKRDGLHFAFFAFTPGNLACLQRRRYSI
jgi:hypothetical protein